MTEIIDLQELSIQLLNVNSQLKNVVLNSKTGITIKAKDLIKHYPELKDLKNLPLINYRKKTDNNDVIILTLNVFNFDDKPVVTIPDSNCNITEEFEILSYFLDIESNKNFSYVIIEHKKYDVKFRINISLTNSKINDLIFDNFEKKLVEGLPDSSWLNDKPTPLIKLEFLPKNEIFEVVSIDKKTDKFESQLISVKDSKNQIYNNCICNTELLKLVKKYGISLKFQIGEIKPEKIKDEKGKFKEIVKVSIISLMSDLSKIELSV